MRTMITTCPNVLQYVPVSTGIRPVTHVADVAVNSAVRNFVGSADFEQTGRHKIALPVSTSARNTSTTICGGRILRNGL